MNNRTVNMLESIAEVQGKQVTEQVKLSAFLARLV